MRRRTPSEIKAYGDGYAEAYKEFCHLLKNHDVDKAVRKMKIFVDAVELTVETATGEPQTEETEMEEYYKDHDEFYDCDRYVVTNDEGERAYNCIGCEQTDCGWR